MARAARTGPILVRDEPPSYATPVVLDVSPRLEFAVHKSKLEALRSDTEIINGEVLNAGLAVVTALAARPFKVIDSINQQPYASKSIETTD